MRVLLDDILLRSMFFLWYYDTNDDIYIVAICVSFCPHCTLEFRLIYSHEPYIYLLIH
jgi:hypothetical protein